jgi:hypothetical protein
MKIMRAILIITWLTLASCTNNSFERLVELRGDVFGLNERKEAALNLRRNKDELNAAEVGSNHDYLRIDPVK